MRKLNHTSDLVRGLLSKAQEDMEAVKILYDRGLKALALNHLEQASEKILKAYFIGYLIDFLRFVYEIAERAGASRVYRSMHQLVKQAVKQYAIPKHLGHDFDAFLNKFLPELYDGICGGIFANYVKYSITHGLIPLISKHREKILARLAKEGLSKEQAEKLLDVTVKFISQVPGVLTDEQLRFKLCSSKSIKEFAQKLRQLRKSNEPCLKATVKLYRFIDKVIKEYGEKGLAKNKEVLQSIEKAKDILEELAKQTGIKIFSEYGNRLSSFILNLIRGNTLVYLTLPLHFCLVKYYEFTRYPEGEVPEEEYSSIPEALEVLEEVHSIVKNLVKP